MMNNLLWLHGKMPEELREHAKLWYVGAEALAEKWCDEHNVSKMQLAGMMACLSPQTDWFQNVSFTQRILDVLKHQQKHRWDSEMERVSKNKSGLADWSLVRGKTFAECPPRRSRPSGSAPTTLRTTRLTSAPFTRTELSATSLSTLMA